MKKKKLKTEFREGLNARKNFDNTMKALFRVPKPIPKKVKKGKD
jgi:hypothetical protein